MQLSVQGNASITINFGLNLETKVSAQELALFRAEIASNLMDILREYPIQLDASHLIEFISVQVNDFTLRD
jgi:hypothetical protein